MKTNEKFIKEKDCKNCRLYLAEPEFEYSFIRGKRQLSLGCPNFFVFFENLEDEVDLEKITDDCFMKGS